MQPKRLLILTAVMIEAKAIAAALQMKCPKPGLNTHKTFGSVAISLGLTGISARNITGDSADIVMMAGLAGALSPDLAAGDLVIDDWAEGTVVPANVRRGTIHSSDRIVSSPAEKSALREQTQAIAVDMENAVVRDWARRIGAQFLAIRAISDRADQSLDPAFMHLVDPWGRPKPLALIRTLFRRPSLIPQVLRLGGDSKRAARRLGQAVREIVDQLASEVPAQTP